MAFDRARQKSFGEPTRVRLDGTRAAPSNDDGQPPQPKGGGGSAYEKYKQSLHAFFNGDKPLPDHLRDLLATRPGASDHLEGVEDVIDVKPAPLTAVAAKKGKATARNARTDDRKARRMVAVSSDDYASLVEAVRRATSPREV